MKVPDKIYATPNFYRRWQTKAIDDESVEYVRKDAFIEKSLEFLDGCISDYVELKHANVDTFMNVDNKRFIEDFKKYMEE